MGNLTKRQTHLYMLLVYTFKCDKEIAYEIGVTINVVKTYNSCLYKKLGIKNGRLELINREINRLNEVVEILTKQSDVKVA